jgi:hypothetical protein
MTPNSAHETWDGPDVRRPACERDGIELDDDVLFIACRSEHSEQHNQVGSFDFLLEWNRHATQRDFGDPMAGWVEHCCRADRVQDKVRRLTSEWEPCHRTSSHRVRAFVGPRALVPFHGWVGENHSCGKAEASPSANSSSADPRPGQTEMSVLPVEVAQSHHYQDHLRGCAVPFHSLDRHTSVHVTGPYGLPAHAHLWHLFLPGIGGSRAWLESVGHRSYRGSLLHSLDPEIPGYCETADPLLHRIDQPLAYRDTRWRSFVPGDLHFFAP